MILILLSLVQLLPTNLAIVDSTTTTEELDYSFFENVALDISKQASTKSTTISPKQVSPTSKMIAPKQANLAILEEDKRYAEALKLLADPYELPEDEAMSGKQKLRLDSSKALSAIQFPHQLPQQNVPFSNSKPMANTIVQPSANFHMTPVDHKPEFTYTHLPSYSYSYPNNYASVSSPLKLGEATYVSTYLIGINYLPSFNHLFPSIPDIALSFPYPLRDFEIYCLNRYMGFNFYMPYVSTLLSDCIQEEYLMYSIIERSKPIPSSISRQDTPSYSGSKNIPSYPNGHDQS